MEAGIRAGEVERDVVVVDAERDEETASTAQR
jgi:hypothetical protein